MHARWGRWKRRTGSEDSMSVEIEVGRENATRVRVPPTETGRLDLTPTGMVSPKVRRILIIAGTILVVTVVGLYLYFHNRETTDDAQVDGHITPVAAKISGRVAQVLVQDNQPVKTGQALVQIDPADYQAAVDQ